MLMVIYLMYSLMTDNLIIFLTIIIIFIDYHKNDIKVN